MSMSAANGNGLEFEGQNVLLIGASGGVGLAAGRLLSERGAGVSMTYRNNSDEVEALVAEAEEAGQRAYAHNLDATDATAVSAVVEQTIADLGSIDACITTIGYINKFVLFLESTTEDAEKHIDIEFRSLMHLTRAVLPHMLERGKGSIVAVGSDSGKVGMIGEAVSSACRAAVNAFAKTIASEYGRQGIRMNAVCPGPIDTGLWEGIRQYNPFSEKLVKAVERSTALKRSGTAEEVAELAVFLASERSGYVTAQALSVNGGGVRC